MKKVAIIGAGPSGITAIKNFADQGFEVTLSKDARELEETGDSMILLDILVFLKPHI